MIHSPFLSYSLTDQYTSETCFYEIELRKSQH